MTIHLNGWFYQAQEHCLGIIVASPYFWFLNQAFINFRTGISELRGITCFGNLQWPLYIFTCNSLRFFLFVCIICYQPSFSILFPLLLPSPVYFWSFLSVFLSCFIYKIYSLVCFLIAPLGYLISIKNLCRYSRNTEENHLSFILCEVSLSLVSILNILCVCDLVDSVIPCDPALFQCSFAILTFPSDSIFVHKVPVIL